MKDLDKVEITTLIDNFIEITATDNSEIVRRAGAVREGEIRRSIFAEHGFSALVRTFAEGSVRTLLFDFGFSEEGAAWNAALLGAPMQEVEALALSHGHSDHFGSLERLVRMTGRNDLRIYLHPGAFKTDRYLKFGADVKARFPRLERERFKRLGVQITETASPLPLLDGRVVFLGEVPRRTEFEKGMPNAFFGGEGSERKDEVEEDSAVVMKLRGKGLIILSGCAHAGIINTVRYAEEITGTEKVHAVMGGFHLAGPAFDPIVGKVIDEFREIDPAYVIPTHCTGRKSIQKIEAALPDRFILNMSGTTLTFAA
jgi:7,8-dihydropterin-6-yl-methyl-4-(beta-D-ribofuranosyl)aminobenzene 5'-phosphate synthase